MTTSFTDARVVVVGVGLIGGSLGLALKRLNVGIHITGVSRADTLATAQDLGAVDDGVAYEKLSDAVSQADLVVLCTPIARIQELLPGVIANAKEGCLITDVGSTKSAIVALAEQHATEGVLFIGGHPMAGSEKSGVTAADPFLFQNAIYALTPGPGTAEAEAERLADLVRCIGGRPLILEPAQHDRIAAAVSHLPQLMATSLVNTIGRLQPDSDLALRMAAGGFRDLTRIASSPYSMWRDICRTNEVPIRDLIDIYVDSLKGLADTLNDDVLEKHFDEANETRARIPKDAKGFLHPLHEILLLVEDRPGILAGVTRALFDANINIDDIELLKIREGEGGTIRLGFDTQETAGRVIDILTEAGYRVRLR